MNGIFNRSARFRTPPSVWFETTATISAWSTPSYARNTRFSKPDPPPSLEPEANTSNLGFGVWHAPFLENILCQYCMQKIFYNRRGKKLVFILKTHILNPLPN